MRQTMPAGFRQAVRTGLYLPTEVSRDKDTWLRDEWRLLDRATKMLKSKGITVLLKCDNPACKEQPITGERMADGSFVLTCAHAKRTMTYAF